MMDCKKYKKGFAAFLYGELEEDERKLFEAHLETCPQCTEELERLKEVKKGANSLQEDIEKAMTSVDWDALPVQIVKNVFKKETHPARESWLEKLSRLIFQPRLKPVYAGLLVGIILGSIATFMVVRTPRSGMVEAGEFFAPRDFLENVELEIARRDTLDYLEKSQYLLLDFVQSPSEEAAEFWRSEFALQKTRDLLSQKKYINSQLNKFQMAKAKAICDQIELLFYELTQISVELSAEEIRKIQRLIEEKDLLLKIKLLKRELKQSEV
jgi:hypothetical protein